MVVRVMIMIVITVRSVNMINELVASDSGIHHFHYIDILACTWSTNIKDSRHSPSIRICGGSRLSAPGRLAFLA